MSKKHLYSCHYESIDDFLTDLDQRPFDPESPLGKKHASIGNGHKWEWYGTHTYLDAVSLARDGDPAAATTMAPARDLQLEARDFSKTLVYDVFGDHVDIGRYVSGLPECMASRQKRGKPIVNILVNVGALVNVDPPEVVERGRQVLSVLSALEASGYGTEITAISEAEGFPLGRRYRVSVKIKPASEYYNAPVIAHWLTSVSILRRLIFRHRETAPVDVQKKLYGYGTTVDPDTEFLESLENTIYFPALKAGRSYSKVVDQVLSKYA